MCCRQAFAELHCMSSFSPLEHVFQSVGRPADLLGSLRLYGVPARSCVSQKVISRFMATISRADLKKLRKRRARLKKKKMSCMFSGSGEIPRPVYVDYKDLKTLRNLIDREGRILPRRRTGTTALYQRAVRTAVLRARFIGLLPFVAEE